jgi:hypothetical protein
MRNRHPRPKATAPFRRFRPSASRLHPKSIPNIEWGVRGVDDSTRPALRNFRVNHQFLIKSLIFRIHPSKQAFGWKSLFFRIHPLQQRFSNSKERDFQKFLEWSSGIFE